jgi:PHD/YefM family antitoxin component YafN of YafNO toxin-antitoxin module
VTKRGKEAVVVLSTEEWALLRGKESSLADFFLSSPLSGSGLEFGRDPSPVRDVYL